MLEQISVVFIYTRIVCLLHTQHYTYITLDHTTHSGLFIAGSISMRSVDLLTSTRAHILPQSLGHMPHVFVAHATDFGAHASCFCGTCHRFRGTCLVFLWHVPQISGHVPQILWHVACWSLPFLLGKYGTCRLRMGSVSYQ